MEDSGSEEEMLVEMVEGFPFGKSRDRDGKPERKQEEREESVGSSGVEGFEVQKSPQCQDADERKVVLVFRVEVELERRNREREKQDVSVGSAGQHVSERAEYREIREHRTRVRSYGTEFAKLPDPGKSVEHGDRLQKHDGEGRTNGVETEDPHGERQSANVRVRQKEQISEAPLARVGVSSEKHDDRDGNERKGDVRNEKPVDFHVGKKPVRQLCEMDRGKHERVGSEYLGRDVVFRSKDGERGESDHGKRESEPSVEFFRHETHRRRKRIGYAVKRQVKKEEAEVIGSGFEKLQRVFLCFGGDF